MHLDRKEYALLAKSEFDNFMFNIVMRAYVIGSDLEELTEYVYSYVERKYEYVLEKLRETDD
jgi:uncharacterized protein YuzB (UPF0349 family)